jgi:hypothetical protein
MEKAEIKLKKLKAKYEAIRKKYKLPTFNELNKEFEIYDIDYNGFITRDIVRKILQKIDQILSIINPILNPNPQSLHSLIETKIFEKSDLEPMFKFYKKLFYFLHKGITEVVKSEDAQVAWIKEIWASWSAIKKEFIGYGEKIAEGWLKVEKEIFTDKYLQ